MDHSESTKPGGNNATHSARPAASGELALKRLPKEFRKSPLAEFDRTFAVILILSLIFHFALIRYFSGRAWLAGEPASITNIQQQYAELLLGDEMLEPPGGEFVTDEGLLPPAQWFDLLEGAGLPVAPGFEAETAETMLPTAETVGDGVRAAAEARAGRRRARSERVREIGLLRIITSEGSGAVDFGSMQSMLEGADANVEQLGTVLSKLDGISVPRYGTPGSRGGRVTVTAEDFRGVRTDRPETDIVDLVGSMEPLTEAEAAPVERNEVYERVQTTVAQKPKPEELRGHVRSPEDVTRVIRSHQSAIQDCYKTALRDNPDLHGEISIRFWVDPDGRVVDVSLVSSTLNDQALESCVLDKMMRWSDFGYSDPEKGLAVYRQVYQFGI